MDPNTFKYLGDRKECGDGPSTFLSSFSSKYLI